MEVKDPLVPAVERPEYETLRAILQRPKATLIQRRKVEASQDQDIPDCPPSDESPSDKSPSEMRPLDLASVASEESDLSSIADGDSISQAVTVKEAPENRDQVTPDIWATNPLVEKTTDMEGLREEDSRDEIEDVSLDQLHSRGQDQGTSPPECGGSDLPSMMSVQPGTGYVTGDPLNDKCATSMSQKTDMDPSHVVEDQPGTSGLDLTWDSDQDYDECVYYHEGSDLYAEDVDGQMAVLPEVPVTTEDVKIKDIQLCGSDNQTPEEIERLRQKIWKFRHLLFLGTVESSVTRPV
ncbi:reverse transcriptase [Phytophthora megakarya]|uniref:Reverse transcriptase n=1 Tax=Phytophthora megakarya TaxID=4795 RepID=A0A225V104_9STRA|nr:reverse transcriptase [Phytophthora megakarya]